MKKIDQIQQLHRLLKSRRYGLSKNGLCQELECSNSTITRLIEDMRNFFHTPIEYSPSKHSYYYGADNQFELPGWWLTASELRGMASILTLLKEMQSGLLGSELEAISASVQQFLQAHHINVEDIAERIRIIPHAKRELNHKIFDVLMRGLTEQKQIHIQYQSGNEQKSQRTLSPQTLVYYRDNWYLDAWCHTKQALRTFLVSRIQRALLQKDTALSIDRDQRKEYFTQSYGIFSGEPTNLAEILINPPSALQISQQQWHPQQQGQWQDENYLLSIPYSDARELLKDLLFHAPDVKVIAPDSLKQEYKKRLQQALAKNQ